MALTLLSTLETRKMKIERLSWEDFDDAVDILNGEIPAHINAIYGQARGGLPLAVALSHASGLPLTFEDGLDVLWVDDIVDSGRTINESAMRFGAYAAWVVRAYNSDILHARIVDEDWVLFPWEDASRVLTDYMAYEDKRNG